MADVLVVNLDSSPLSVASLSRAMKLILSGKAKVAENSEKVIRSSGGFAMPLPTVVRMCYYVIRGKAAAVKLTKPNVLARDNWCCQYCGVQGTATTMTVDHVHPRSKGGESSWKNLVTSCSPCNALKADQTLLKSGLKLRRRPYRPLYIPFIVVKRRNFPSAWGPYLFMIEERLTTSETDAIV